MRSDVLRVERKGLDDGPRGMESVFAPAIVADNLRLIGSLQ